MDSTKATALLQKDLQYLKAGIDDIKKELQCMKEDRVSQVEFKLTNKEQNGRINQVEKLVFGAIGLTLISLGKVLMDMILNWNK